MQFELTEALIDMILFAMENQDGEFCLDTAWRIVADRPEISGGESADDGENGARYIELPRWDSSSGFRLMERFTAGLKNPLIRGELSSALNQKKGVFRAFKNTLGRRPEAEKLWFSFKEQEMKKEIAKWYNGLREEWGLQKIGLEPEETDDLVLEDFRFRPFRRDDLAGAEELHRVCLEEAGKNLAESGAEKTAGILLEEFPAFPCGLNSFFDTAKEKPFAGAMTAESGNGEFAGFISGEAKGGVFHIQNLEVKPEYRGLGIGETLLSRFLKDLENACFAQVLFDLPSWSNDFSRVLLRESFIPQTVRFRLKLRDGQEAGAQLQRRF